MNRCICIHGHFYQPPRENAWLEAIEYQESAAPYHDWNERIADECYGPNAHARILDATGLINRIVNNYSRISFNFGPTLLSWMQLEDPDTYRAILEADRLSMERFDGHGSAIAQAYNHAIMPLCNDRDRKTQAIWGVRDFETRFGRAPEGIWLPETAVDIPSLEALAAAGIKFTILEPHQATAVRPIGGKKWRELNGATLDPTMAYQCKLPSGASIAIFFYDGPISRAIAFEGLLNRGEALYSRLKGALDDGRDHPQIVHIATDGESYGHHHRYGEMALAYALKLIEEDPTVELVNYGLFLERNPPTYEVKINERTAWSCAHGVGRWERDCGCSTGSHPGWNQAWRGPLRAALDDLREAVTPVFESTLAGLLKDPWAAREAYIEIVLGRTPARLDRFFEAQAVRPLNEEERSRALRALEMQRHAMLMYTSCGWFFDDIGGIETVQIMQYAARAAQLAGGLTGKDFEQPLLAGLEKAKSNIPALGDGRRIWEKEIVPARVDLAKVAAHHSVTLLFKEHPRVVNTYCYTIERLELHEEQAGRSRLAIGRLRVASDVVYNRDEFSFAVLYFGGHNLTGGVRQWPGDQEHAAMREILMKAFERADIPEAIRCLDRSFEAATYSLRSLFKDEQRWVLTQMLESAVSESELAYREVHKRSAPLVRFLDTLGVPIPRAFRAAAEFSLGSQLRAELQREEPDLERLDALLDQVAGEHVKPESAELEYPLRRHVERLLRRLSLDPSNVVELFHCLGLVRLLPRFPFLTDLAKAQNLTYRIMENVLAGRMARAEQGDDEARQWLDAFRELGAAMSIRVEAPAPNVAARTRASAPA